MTAPCASRRRNRKDRSMSPWKAIIPAVAALAVLGAYIVALHLAGPGPAGAAIPQQHMPAMPVPVARIVKKTVPIFLEYPGRTEAIRSITLQAKVSGFVQEQVVPDGADV